MFKVGEYIVCGSNSVCKVENIRPIDVTGISKDKLYYILSPINTKGSKLFTPIDNEKVIIRSVISKEDALALIEDIDNIKTLSVEDEKKRDNIYKEALKTCDCRELLSIIKTSYLRKQSRLAEGKKMTISDEKYLRLAEESLYGELAISLEIEKNKVEEIIEAKVHGVNNTLLLS